MTPDQREAYNRMAVELTEAKRQIVVAREAIREALHERNFVVYVPDCIQEKLAASIGEKPLTQVGRLGPNQPRLVLERLYGARRSAEGMGG